MRALRSSPWLPAAVLAFAGACSNGGAATSGDAGDVADAAAPSSDGSLASDASSDGDSAADASGSTTPADGSLATCGDHRPQLTDAQAAQATILDYLASAGTLPGGVVTDNWDPTAGVGDVATFSPTFTVAASGGTHTTVQSAIDAALARGGASRIYILVSPGTYREIVCIPAAAPPITLYSTSADPTQTLIVYDNYAGLGADAGPGPNPCSGIDPATMTYGIAGSATFSAFAAGFQAKNLTFSNDVSVATLRTTTGTQGVALMTDADRIVLENVHVLGHQDSLFIDTPDPSVVSRAYVKGSLVAGDVDFIFGGASFVLDGCEIRFVSDRRPTGEIVAPSTDSRVDHGLLIVGGTFTSDVPLTGAVALGRAWDRNCANVPSYVSTCMAAGHYPNGEAIIRNAMLGAHISGTAPWVAAATSKRQYCNTPWACAADAGADCPANRLFEYQNTGPGSAH